MENVLYKMMISNASVHVSKQNPLNPERDGFDAFKISEVLAIVLGKSKEDILMDIVNSK